MSSDAQSSIDHAIKTRGTCTDMCDKKERVDRIYQNAVDIEETVSRGNQNGERAALISGSFLRQRQDIQSRSKAAWSRNFDVLRLASTGKFHKNFAHRKHCSEHSTTCFTRSLEKAIAMASTTSLCGIDHEPFETTSTFRVSRNHAEYDWRLLDREAVMESVAPRRRSMK